MSNFDFVDVGFGNFVESKKIISISHPDPAPTRRMVNQAKDEGRYVDLTEGKKTRSIIISSDAAGMLIVGSSLQPNTIIGRMAKKTNLQKAKIDQNGHLDDSPIEVIGSGCSE
jgi:regulator of extracellular matrix RemA (YlzA/DUF370 family)